MFCEYFRVTQFEKLKLSSLFNDSLSHLLVPILLNFIPLDQLGLIWTWDIIVYWCDEKRGRFSPKQKLRNNFFRVFALLQFWGFVSYMSVFVFLRYFSIFLIQWSWIRFPLIIAIRFLSYFIRSNPTFLRREFQLLFERVIVSFVIRWCKLFLASWVFLAVRRLRVWIRVANVFGFIWVREISIACYIFRCWLEMFEIFRISKLMSQIPTILE